ncbi:hypothetical protein Hanom_Chr17g01554351 [Helianthus anomalus]
MVRNYDMKTLRAVNGADAITKALNLSINTKDSNLVNCLPDKRLMASTNTPKNLPRF